MQVKNRIINNSEMTVSAAFQTILICLLFGGNAVAIKLSLTGLGPFTSAGIRFAIAAVIIFLWAKLKKIPLMPTSAQVRQCMVLSTIFVVQLSLFYTGLGKTTASHGVLIANMLPFFVLILAHFFIPGDSITLKKLIGISLGFMGVVVLYFDSQDMAYNLRVGDGMILLAVICWSISAVRVKQIIAGYNSLQITLFPMVFAVPFFFIGGYFLDAPMISKVDQTVVVSMMYQAFVTASFGFLAWNSLLQRFGATTLHSFIFIMPLAGVLAGVFLLDETITPYLAAAIVCIVAGVLVVNVRK